MITITDISFVYSGGYTNTDPNLSLGGASSIHPIPGGINNLFNNIPDTGDFSRATGMTDYRCFYAVNNNATDSFYQVAVTIVDQISGGATATIGNIQATDIQNVTITYPIQNSDFENLGSTTMFESWIDESSSTPLAVENTIVHYGTHSVKWSGHADAATNSNLLYQEFTAKPNTIYTVTYWVLGSVGSQKAIVPRLLDADKTPLGGSTFDIPFVGDGTTWQQATIVFDPTPAILTTPTLLLAFSDETLTDPTWTWYLDDVYLKDNAGYTLIYTGTNPSTSIHVADSDGITLQNALNLSGIFTGAVVNSVVGTTNIVHTINFLGPDDSRWYNTLTSNDAGITIEKVQNGGPIHRFPDVLIDRFTTPGNVTFGNTLLPLNELRAGEVFYIWSKRTIAAGTTQQDNDGFTIRINGNVFPT